MTQLQQLAGNFPLSSLPDDKNRLEELIERSWLSFKGGLPQEQRRLLFVLEVEGQIIGSSQILSYQEQNHSYFLLCRTEKEETVLQLSEDKKGRTQLGGLILNPQYRRHPEKWGRQIGLFRFLYMAEYPEAFTETIEVSLTAPLQKKGNESLFWNCMNFSKLPKDYKSALQLYKTKPSLFFSRFPKTLTFPLKNLPEKLRDSLASIHSETLPAYRGLLKLGFKKTSRHHILDGGIFLEAKKRNLSILNQSRQVLLKQGQPTKTEIYLWGRENSKGFSGSSIKGELKGDVLISDNLPSSMENLKIRLIPLYPK